MEDKVLYDALVAKLGAQAGQAAYIKIMNIKGKSTNTTNVSPAK